ncbi:MAG: response regulator [Anaerolineales bacterium]|nr:response regulator [Anaerolineales bacterium]MCS7247294.1 response regulator [Anaerolineales bacterium]MDW8161105.1 response regulator [Anaerolineales bacterium]MDW8446256.1 response regulator [Anaerolineales bacterium]
MENGRPKKVLIIDEDLSLCESLKFILDPDEFILANALSGVEGVRLCQEWQPDVVVLDLLMPGIDGWELAARIRSFSNVPIIVLSAVSRPELVAKALNEGIDEYLIKPVPNAVLAAHVKRLTRRTQAPSNR